MIEVSHLSKSYGTLEAVSDVSFRVDAGEVVGFLGPNGAGKSTTLRIVAGFLGATRGRVTIAGYDMATDALTARGQLGYMPETSPLYPEMRVDEYLRFRAELKGVPRSKRRAELARVVEDAGLIEVAETLIAQLSKGYRQRVGLADALLGSPPLLILDEPTAGLDPNQIREVRNLVRRLAQSHTIFLSTHILSEVEATCSRGIVIARGKLVAEGTIEELRKLRRSSGLSLVVRGDRKKARAAAKVAGVRSVKTDSEGDVHRLTVLCEDGVEIEEIAERTVSALCRQGIGVREVTPKTVSLEQVFSELTETSASAGASADGPSDPTEDD
jgi:ABC-2 type transport system ATP-binding protein